MTLEQLANATYSASVSAAASAESDFQLPSLTASHAADPGGARIMLISPP